MRGMRATRSIAKLLFCLAVGSVWWHVGAAQALGSTAAAATKQSEERFDVHEFRVLGNTTLATIDIERTVYPFLGDRKVFADVESARAALEKAYHDRGYDTVFVDLPPQDVAEGIVRLRVTEGRLRQTRVSGTRYFSNRQILAELPAAAPGKVPQFPELQKELAAVNAQTSDRSVVPILKAGPTPGTVDLTLKVDDHVPLHGSFELNDQYTPDTKPLRATFALSYDNLFGRLDNISVQYQDSPQRTNQVGVFAANYAASPLASGLRPSVYYINSSSDVATVGTIGVIGKGTIAGLRLSYPMPFGSGVQSLTLGADYKHFRETINLDASNALATPISYTNLSLAYSGAWKTDARDTSFSASADFGPRGFGNDAAGFANKRFQGRPNYFYLRLDGSLNPRLPFGFHLNTRLAGQFAVEPLITNENYSIAGNDGVRGYLEAEELGDSAIKGTTQLFAPLLHWHEQPLADAFVFYDIGATQFIDSLPGSPTHVVLRSAGAGFDFLPGRPISGVLTWADPLVSASRTRSGQSRYLFVVRGTF